MEQKRWCMLIFLVSFLFIGLESVGSRGWIYAQEGKFPVKPIELVVPYAPGGIVDLGSRVVTEALSRELKVPVIVKNQPGGGGLVAPTAYLTVKADGYSLLAGSSGAIITTNLLSKTPAFDPRTTFLPVGFIADSPIALSVPNASPFKSIADLVQFAKKNPGKLKGGVSSIGSENHIMFMSVLNDTKIDIKMIPYTATGTLVTAILGEHVDWMTLTLPATLPYAKSGGVRILALTKKSPELPGVPAGPAVGLPGFSSTIWMGILVLPQTPKAIYEKLVATVQKVTQDPETKKKLASLGFNVNYKGPQEFSNFLNDQWENSSRIIKETGIKVN